MHHALAVPTQNGGSHPGGGGVRRLSIDAEPTRVDLVLSAATPIGLLIPPIVDILTRSSGFRAGPLAVHYQLSLPGGTALDPSKTLAQLGIRDGAALLLTSSPTELMVPRFDDEAEAVSASVSVMEWRWTRRRARLVGSLVTTWLAGVAATVLTRAVFHANDAHRTGCAGVAATIALLSLLAAAIAYRVSREQSIGLTLGGLATSFAALAGLLAVPGGPGAPNALFAAAAAATCAAAMRVISSYAVAFTALVSVCGDRRDCGHGGRDHRDPTAGYRRSVHGHIVGVCRSIRTAVGHACATVPTDGGRRRRCAVLRVHIS